MFKEKDWGTFRPLSTGRWSPRTLERSESYASRRVVHIMSPAISAPRKAKNTKRTGWAGSFYNKTLSGESFMTLGCRVLG